MPTRKTATEKASVSSAAGSVISQQVRTEITTNEDLSKVAPVLVSYRANNPHANGWNGAAAEVAAAEYANRCTPDMTVLAAMTLMAEYVPYCGWKHPSKALAAKLSIKGTRAK